MKKYTLWIKYVGCNWEIVFETFNRQLINKEVAWYSKYGYLIKVKSKMERSVEACH